MTRRRIAIVGTGIAGLSAARFLHDHHDIEVFEASDRIGGHTATVEVPDADGELRRIDTGFIVHNDHTYPLFSRLMAEIGIRTRPTTMSFGVRCDRTGIEYAGSSFGAFFAQRGNLAKPTHWKMLFDILRFRRESPAILDGDADPRLGDWLDANGYSQAFVERFIVPMGSAIWSGSPESVLAFPARFFVAFFHNHGFLRRKDRPQWRVLENASSSYLRPLTEPFADKIRCSTPVTSVRRTAERVQVETSTGTHQFDDVVIACHTDQTLRILSDAQPLERRVLEGIPYAANDVVLHHDESVMPKRSDAHAAWNYRIPAEPLAAARVTYDMNRLQVLDCARRFLVTLNDTASIDADKILFQTRYDHPQFTLDGIAAREELRAVNGSGGVWLCGAWMGNGFHEDGVRSAFDVVTKMGIQPW